jgi:hypothetical protein
MTKGRNKTRMVGWHPSAGLVARLDAEVKSRGGGRGAQSAILEEALNAYLPPAREEPPRSRGIDIPAISAPHERGELAGPAASTGGAEREGCPHPKARVLKGLCGACGTHVGAR